MRAPRLLVLACDGTDPRVILDNRPHLPMLDALCREGSYGIIDSLSRPADVWTTYYAGLPPKAHGEQARRVPESGEPAGHARDMPDLFLWDWMGRWGLTAGFVGPPYTYPAPGVNGFFVAGPPLSGTDRAVHPPDLASGNPLTELSDQELRQILSGGYFRNLPELLRPRLERYADWVLRLCERRPVDVLWVHFPEARLARHFLMREQLPRTLVRAYAELDRVFGRLAERLRPQSVLFLADHGLVPAAWQHTGEPPSPGMAEGFFALRGPGVYRGKRCDIHFHDGFRLIVRAAGLPAPPGKAGRTPPVFNEFSQRRAAEYDQQQWAANPDYLSAFLAFADLKPEHHVLEAGVGTGQVAAVAAPRVARYVGVDNSEEMLAQAWRKLPGLELLHADLRAVPLPDRSFDRVLARSVLHHVTDGLEQAMRELYRVLRPGGRLVIGEGIPPSPESVAHFIEVFALKEERLVLLPQHLVRLLEGAGFVDIRYRVYVMPQVSVRGWLERSDLSEALKARLLEMHRTTPPEVQRAYRTTVTQDDVLIDFTFALVSGSRPSW